MHSFKAMCKNYNFFFWLSSKDIAKITELAHDELAKCLTSLLQPVLDFYSSVKDSGTIAENMQHLNLNLETIFRCSFNTSNLFTNILLKAIIQICDDTLHNSEFLPGIFYS